MSAQEENGRTATAGRQGGSPFRAQILVVGSGAGGALTAALLAEAGRDVLLMEEGPCVDTSAISTNTPDAMRRLYRNGGLSPILGRPAMAFIEGCCVGGSTEINSAFWHRPPPEILDEWRRDYAVRDLADETLAPLLDELEAELQVARLPPAEVPLNSQLFRRGAEALGWRFQEVARAQAGDLSGSAFAAGAKRSMTQSFIPRALRAGARLLPDCRAIRLELQQGRVTAVYGVRREGGRRVPVRVVADHVFVCGGAIQTPVLLRSSGLRRNIGRNLQLHPMLKVAAEFDTRMDCHASALPVYQVKEFAPEITLGGAVFTPGFLALTLSDNWTQNEAAMGNWRQMALYYVSTRGRGRGQVRGMPVTREAFLRYRFDPRDRANLNTGLQRLCEVLFAAGARRLYPGIRSRALFAGAGDAREFLRRPLSLPDLSLSVLHVFGTCPMGEDARRCAVDSYGRVHGLANLHVNDAAILPTATGVNPQGTIMAVALRNARHFLQEAP